MITFKQYLAIDEAIIKPWEQFPVETERAVDMLNSSHKDGLKAITTGGLLFRGFKGTTIERGLAGVIDPSKGERTSRDSNNAYQLAMGRSPALSEYPSRGKSLICSTSLFEARHYGTPYIVVPADGATVAVSAFADFLETEMRDSITLSVESFNTLIRKAAEYLDVDRGETNKFTDADALNKAFDAKSAEELAALFNEYSACQLTRATLIEFFNQHKTNRFDAIAAKNMTPQSLGLRLVKFGDVIGPSEELECWVSARCMVIPCSMFGDILARLDEQKFPIHNKYLQMLKKDVFKTMAGRAG